VKNEVKCFINIPKNGLIKYYEINIKIIQTCFDVLTPSLESLQDVSAKIMNC